MNIYGIGIDIVEIDRIEKAINKNEKFLNRVFTKKEIEYFKSKNLNINTISGNFAGKEAVSKAIGTGIRNYNFNDIEILRDHQGKPFINVKNNLINICEELKIKEILISISHSKNYAVANAVAITKEI
ncbi:MAG TPA: holo-ACP synthase [Peptostreptococcaceae bacterium]|jgi:holo-[acyl-carrier protein] synthase|nr:holo-ACP synthase [Peptostreptococcaceae bacterium]